MAKSGVAEKISVQPAALDVSDPSLVDLRNPGQRADIVRVRIRDVGEFSNAFRVLSTSNRVLSSSNQQELDALRERFVPLGQPFDSFVDGHGRYLQCS